MVHGRIALTRAATAMLAEGDYPKAIANLDRAYELAQRFGDRDTQMLALVAKGRGLVKSGKIKPDARQTFALKDLQCLSPSEA